MNKILMLGVLFMGTAMAAETIKVIDLKGTASERVGRGVLALKVGSEIHEKSQIIVDADSVLLISMGKDVVTKLGPGSKSSVEIFNKKDWQLKLEKGVTASAIRNPEKRPNHFQVKNRNITLGVRGTVFYTEAEDKRPTFMCTCKGTVSVQDEHGKQIDSITATHHDRPITFESSGKETIVKTAPMGNGHSDADVAYLENWLGKL